MRFCFYVCVWLISLSIFLHLSIYIACITSFLFLYRHFVNFLFVLREFIIEALDGCIKYLVRYFQHLIHLDVGMYGLSFLTQVVIFLVLGVMSWLFSVWHFGYYGTLDLCVLSLLLGLTVECLYCLSADEQGRRMAPPLALLIPSWWKWGIKLHHMVAPKRKYKLGPGDTMPLVAIG